MSDAITLHVQATKAADIPTSIQALQAAHSMKRGSISLELQHLRLNLQTLRTSLNDTNAAVQEKIKNVTLDQSFHETAGRRIASVIDNIRSINKGDLLTIDGTTRVASEGYDAKVSPESICVHILEQIAGDQGIVMRLNLTKNTHEGFYACYNLQPTAISARPAVHIANSMLSNVYNSRYGLPVTVDLREWIPNLTLMISEMRDCEKRAKEVEAKIAQLESELTRLESSVGIVEANLSGQLLVEAGHGELLRDAASMLDSLAGDSALEASKDMFAALLLPKAAENNHTDADVETQKDGSGEA